MKRTRRLAFLLVLCLLVGMVALPVSASAAAKVKLSKTKVTLKVKQTVTLKLKGATGKVTWSTSDKKVATVSKKGKVKAVAGGACKITAKNGKKKYTCKVTVIQPVKKITLSSTKLELNFGQSAELTAVVSPSSASNKQVSWSSSNSDIAWVDENGVIWANDEKEGTAKITVKAKDGSKKKATCQVTVKKGDIQPYLTRLEFTTENVKDYIGLEFMTRYNEDRFFGTVESSIEVMPVWKNDRYIMLDCKNEGMEFEWGVDYIDASGQREHVTVYAELMSSTIFYSSYTIPADANVLKDTLTFNVISSKGTFTLIDREGVGNMEWVEDRSFKRNMLRSVVLIDGQEVYVPRYVYLYQ